MQNNESSQDKRVNSVDDVFEEKAVAADNDKFGSERSIIFLISIIIGVLIIFLTYFVYPDSRVKAVSVNGNEYFTTEYIKELAGVEIDKVFYLVFPEVIEKRITSFTGFVDCDVQLLQDNVVSIEVVENMPLGYRFEEDVPVVLYKDGKMAPLSKETMSLVSKIPLITGFEDEQETHRFCTNFNDVDQNIINEIAEIEQYSLPYDDETIRIRMSDGQIIFSNYYSLGVLNNYHEIKSRMTNDRLCLYAEGSNSVAVARACPWNEVPVEYEYWIDDDGNYITNKWGDRCVKHYYQDSNGGFYLDGQGNRILIPITKAGTDIVDSDFIEHYFLGYYETGELVLPNEEGDLVSDDEPPGPLE